MAWANEIAVSAPCSRQPPIAATGGAVRFNQVARVRTELGGVNAVAAVSGYHW